MQGQQRASGIRDGKQSRSKAACLSCRSARHACKTKIDDSEQQALDHSVVGGDCVRCEELGLRCTWMPSRRFGRPRKQQTVTRNIEERTSSRRETSEQQVNIDSEEFNNGGNFARLLVSWIEGAISSSSIEQNQQRWEINESMSSKVERGLQFYFSLTVDPIPRGLTRMLDFSSLPVSSGLYCLVLASSAYGLRIGDVKDNGSNYLYQQARHSIAYQVEMIVNAASTSCMTKYETLDAVHALEAATIMARYAYGMSSLDDCTLFLSHCARIAKKIGLPCIDADRCSSSNTAITAMLDRCSQVESCQMDSTCIDYTQCRHCLSNVCRQAWWEARMCNAIVFAATSRAGPEGKEGEESVLGLEGKVLSPRMENDQFPLFNRLWSLRARTAAVLSEAVDTNLRRSMGVKDAEVRLSVIDEIILALIASTKELINEFEKATLSENTNNTTHLTWQQCHTIASRGLILLYASQTSLHRIFWQSHHSQKAFHSIQEKGIDVNQSEVDATNQLQEKLMLKSVVTLDENARSIIALMGTLSSSVRDCCPFNACVLVAAVLAKAIALTAHVREVGCTIESSNEDDGTSQLRFDLCTCRQGASKDGALLWPMKTRSMTNSGTMSLQQEEWKRLASIQSLRTAQDMLQGTAEYIWPFAGECRQTIEANRKRIGSSRSSRYCHSTLSFALQHV